MKRWPKSWWAQAVLALVGATLLAVFSALVAFRLSFAYFVWKYPNDGQDVLGSVFLALVIGPVVEIIGFVHLLLLQRARTAKSRAIEACRVQV
jgi:hypothetical protein